MTKFYVAYGSNLNLKQMAIRCPNAKRIEVGKLEGYELLFKGQVDHAYATVEKNPEYSVDVLLWEIDSQSENSLDHYEGYPHLYTKEVVNVKTLDNREIEGMMYVMNPKFERGLPTHTYFMTVLEGYMDNGIDVEPLIQALTKTSVQMEQVQENPVQQMEL